MESKNDSPWKGHLMQFLSLGSGLPPIARLYPLPTQGDELVCKYIFVADKE